MLLTFILSGPLIHNEPQGQVPKILHTVHCGAQAGEVNSRLEIARDHLLLLL